LKRQIEARGRQVVVVENDLGWTLRCLGVVEFEVSYNVASVAGKMLILSSPEVCVAEDLGIVTYLPPNCVCACKLDC